MALSVSADADAAGGGAGTFRLLAMYRSAACVAASFDAGGGFAQYPSGGLMLVWNRKDGCASCYDSSGRPTHSFNTRR